MVEVEFLGHFKMTVAPGKSQVRRCSQGSGIAGKLVEAAVRRFFQLRVVNDHGEGPAARVRSRFRVDQVQNLLGLRIIRVLFNCQLLTTAPRLEKLHAVQVVLNNDGALLGIFSQRGRRGCSSGNG